MIVFGLVGYLMKKLDYEPVPLVFAFVLGSMLEFKFRQTMAIASHNLSFFLTRPVALGALSISIFIIISGFWGHFWKLRKKAIDSGILDD